MTDIHPLLARLRPTRTAYGLRTIADAAAHTGLPRSVYASYELGIRQPSAVRLDHVYRAVGQRLAVIPADVDDTEVGQALRLLAAHKAAVAAYPCGTCGEVPSQPSSEGNGFGYRCRCGDTFANPSAALDPGVQRMAVLS